jgi:hypothetical protein
MKLRGMIFMLLFICFSYSTKATENINSMQTLYIYNFMKLIKWPDNSVGEKFIIGVYGSDQMFTQLTSYTKTRKIGTKNIQVLNLRSAADVSRCQVAFVASSQSSSIQELKNKITNQACLIVSEKQGVKDAAIEFVRSNNKLGFKIEEEEIKAHNLTVSRRLIDMAVRK